MTTEFLLDADAGPFLGVYPGDPGAPPIPQVRPDPPLTLGAGAPAFPLPLVGRAAVPGLAPAAVLDVGRCEQVRGVGAAPPDCAAVPDVLSRRQKAARGVLAKVDSLYLSVNALETVSRLLEDVHSFLMASTDLRRGALGAQTMEIPCKCLLVA